MISKEPETFLSEKKSHVRFLGKEFEKKKKKKKKKPKLLWELHMLTKEWETGAGSPARRARIGAGTWDVEREGAMNTK